MSLSVGPVSDNAWNDGSARGIRTKAHNTRHHKLGAVADCTNGRILDHDALVAHQECLQGLDDGAELVFVASVVESVLGIQQVMQRVHVLCLVHGAAAGAAQLLHVTSHTKDQANMNAEGSNIGAGLAGHPKDAEFALIIELEELDILDRADPQLSLDGRHNRRPLEHGAFDFLEGSAELVDAARKLVVKADDGDVLLASSLLGLDQARRLVNADDQAARDLGVECAAVAGLVDSGARATVSHVDDGPRGLRGLLEDLPQDSLDPRHHLVARGIGGLVEVDDAILDVVGDRTHQRGTSRGGIGGVRRVTNGH